MRSYTCIVNMLINKNFLGLDDRYCLIEKFLCTHVHECENIDICIYPNLAKELIAQERPCCSQRETPALKSVISIESYVYKEMIRLFPMKVPVQNYNDVDWFRQAKNTELTCACNTFSLWFLSAVLILCKRCRCKRKHIELVNTQRFVFVCSYTLTWSSETTEFKQPISFLWQTLGILKKLWIQRVF